MISWKLWFAVPSVKLWEGVALVLGIEPTSLEPLRDSWMAGPGRGPHFERRSFDSQHQREQFEKALNFAERATNVAGPIHLKGPLQIGMNRRQGDVALRDVAAFFVSADWPDIPGPLLDLVDARQTSGKRAPVTAAEVTVTHSIRRKADPLAAVLAEAEKQALNRDDWQSVWAVLVKLAESESRPPPLLGYVEEEGVQYKNDSQTEPVKYLTKDAYRRRHGRAG